MKEPVYFYRAHLQSGISLFFQVPGSLSETCPWKQSCRWAMSNAGLAMRKGYSDQRGFSSRFRQLPNISVAFFLLETSSLNVRSKCCHCVPTAIFVPIFTARLGTYFAASAFCIFFTFFLFFKTIWSHRVLPLSFLFYFLHFLSPPSPFLLYADFFNHHFCSVLPSQACSGLSFVSAALRSNQATRGWRRITRLMKAVYGMISTAKQQETGERVFIARCWCHGGGYYGWGLMIATGAMRCEDVEDADWELVAEK